MMSAEDQFRLYERLVVNLQSLRTAASVLGDVSAVIRLNAEISEAEAKMAELHVAMPKAPAQPAG